MRHISFVILAVSAFALYGCADDFSPDVPFLDIDESSSSDSEKEDTAPVYTGYEDSADSSDDNIANTSFDRTITIVFSTSGNATVTGDNGYVSVSGNDVTANNTGSEKIMYVLQGATDDGFFKLYSSKKQAIKLDGVSITNKGGAAINNQSGKRTFVVVEGNNTLKDASSYSDEISSEDMKAAFFSEGQLVFSGSGTLNVTATGKAGITSDDYLRFMSGPTIKVSSSAGHALRGKDAIIVSGGTIEASASAAMKKGFSSDSLVLFEGGNTTIKVTGGTAYDDEDKEYTGSAGVKADKMFVMNDGTLTISNSGQGGKGIRCNGNAYFNGGKIYASASGHEAIESKNKIEISGGEVYAYASDDAINAAGDFTISGGYVCGLSTGNDGMDSNGNFYIKGGVVLAGGSTSPEVALDANTEARKQLYLEGGTLIAFGPLENGASISQALVSSSRTANTNYALYDGTTLLCAFKTPSSSIKGSGLIVSHSSMKSGSKYSLYSGVSITGAAEKLEGLYFEGGSVSGGSKTELTASMTASSTAGGGGGFPGGGGGGRH
ncbi:MAG: carbohydrate-binding domain-containing protein [Bacteroidales bacterium]|nr:carbohydrate-binding domain-containing protein [Bacteroidales bacterium]